MVSDGFNEALMYAFISDNQGPPTPEQVHATLDCITNASGGVGLFPGTPSGGVSETTGSYHIYV